MPSWVPPVNTVAIVGGGASGVIAALKLAELPVPPKVVMIDPSPGRGLAYGGSQPLHLLNTRAANMSLEGPCSDGFLNWLNARQAEGRGWNADDFVPRRTFGAYLQDALERLFARGAVRLERAWAMAVQRTEGGWRIELDGGRACACDAVLLATGNARPRPLAFPGAAALADLVIDDPWSEAAIAAIPDDGTVLLVGAGLTAVDVAVTLLHRTDGPAVIAASRRGLLPRVHDRPHDLLPQLAQPFPTTARDLYARVRALCEAVAGDDVLARHRVFLGLKPAVPQIWSGLPLAEKRRFSRHLRAWWEVERHRLAPQIAGLLQAGRSAGRFETGRGRILEARRTGSSAEVVMSTPGGGRRTLQVSRIVNCTGPDWRVEGTADPLLHSVLAVGGAADAMGLGLDVDADGEVRGPDGALPGLYALGPLTRGAFFEITAVPEIRAQAERLAARIGADLALAAAAPPPRGRRFVTQSALGG